MPTEVRIGATNAPVLDAFMSCRDRCSFVMGPLGSGKTYGALQRILAQCTEQPPNPQGVRPTRWLAVRNTYPDLMGTTVKDALSVFEGLGRMRYGGLEPPTFYLQTRLPDGTTVKSEIVFLALDRDDAVRKIRGYQITGAWLNETKELVRSVVSMIDLRHGRYPSMASGGVKCGWHGLLGDTNAPDLDHWYAKLAEEVKPKGWTFYRQPGGVIRALDMDGNQIPNKWVENPAAENVENLPDDYYTAGMEGKDEDWIAVMLSNEYGFVVDGLPVHPEFVDSVHTAKEAFPPDERYPLVLGLDFGRTPAAAICQYLEDVGRWVCIDELTSENMSAAIFGPELKRYLDMHYPTYAYTAAWSDPSGEAGGQATEHTPIEIMRASGIPSQPCATNSPILRRSAVSNPCRRLCMDGKPAFLLSPKAKQIRKGLMGGFCYRRMKIPGSEQYTELPDKGPLSHPVEALEYCLMGGGEGREALRQPFRGTRQTEAIM